MPDSFLSDVGKGVTLSNFGTVFSIGAGIYGAIDSQKQWANVNRKLDQILEQQKVILQGIDSVYAEVLENRIGIATTKWLNDIDGWFNDLTNMQKNPPRNKAEEAESAKELAELFPEPVKFDNHLRQIESAIMGGELTSLKADPVMKILNEVITNEKRGTQSQYFAALSFFDRWLLVQQKALILLAFDYKYKHPQAETSQIIEALRKHTHDGTVVRFERQAKTSADLVKQLDPYYFKEKVGDTAGVDYISFGISSEDDDDVHWVDTNRVETDAGYVAVGLQLYQKGPRLAIRVLQAPFRNGVIEQTLPGKEPDRKQNNEHNDNVIRVCEAYEYVRFYVSLAAAEAPPREIMTGARLYVRGNWICVGIQTAKLNQTLSEVDEASRHWTDTALPKGKSEEDTDFFTIKGTCKYINTAVLTPKPLAPLRGAKLNRYFNGDAHFVNLGVKTGLCDVKDLWKRYDITEVSKAVATGSPDGAKRVFLRDSKGLDFDVHGFGSPYKPVLEVVRFGADEVGFKMRTEYDEIYLFASETGEIGSVGGPSQPGKVFEWTAIDDGTIILKANNGKYVRRKPIGDGTVFMMAADQDSPGTAERFAVLSA